MEGIDNLGNFSGLLRVAEGLGLGSCHYIDINPVLWELDPANIDLPPHLEAFCPPSTVVLPTRVGSMLAQSIAAVGRATRRARQHNAMVKAQHQVASGAYKWAHTREYLSTQTALAHVRSMGYQVVAYCQEEGDDLEALDLSRPTCLLVGNSLHVSEGAKQLADARVRIPLRGMSRNLAMTSAVSMLLQRMDRAQRGAGRGVSKAERNILEARYMLAAGPTSHKQCIRQCLPAPTLQSHTYSTSHEIHHPLFTHETSLWLSRIFDDMHYRGVGKQDARLVRRALLEEN